MGLAGGDVQILSGTLSHSPVGSQAWGEAYNAPLPLLNQDALAELDPLCLGAAMSLLHLPTELLLEIAIYLTTPSLSHLLLTNRRLNTTLTPTLHTRAHDPKTLPPSPHWPSKDPHTHTPTPIPALVWSILRNHPPLTSLLIHQGANPNLTNTTNTPWAHSPFGRPFTTATTPLHLAAISSPPSTINLLLSAGANPNALANYNITPLITAVEWARPETVCILLEAGANPHAKDALNASTPLHTAAGWRRNPQIVRLLLAAGANPDDREDSGNTALHCAVDRYQFRETVYVPSVEVVELLLEAGADVNATYRAGVTALHTAAGFERCADMVKVLIKAGADVNFGNRHKETPLHQACSHVGEGHPSACVVETLLEAGAEVNAVDRWGSTPVFGLLDPRAEFPETGVILRMLVDRGADLEVEENGKSAYEMIVRSAAAEKFIEFFTETGVEEGGAEVYGALRERLLYELDKVSRFLFPGSSS